MCGCDKFIHLYEASECSNDQHCAKQWLMCIEKGTGTKSVVQMCDQYLEL